jgi:Rrf2 family protein
VKFSPQEEFGLRCLLQIARLGPDAHLTIPEISRLEGMNATHTAKLLMILRKSGFIVSTRGQQGGYALARPADKIIVGEVLAALGGRLYDDAFCGRHRGLHDICTHAIDCSVRSLWQVVQTSVDNILDRISLADLIKSTAETSNVRFTALPRVSKAVTH